MKKFFSYFLQGLLVIVPAWLTVLIIVKVIGVVSTFFTDFGLLIHPKAEPFLIFIITIFLIYLIGLLASSILFRPLFTVLDSLLQKLPLIKNIYSPLKDMVDAFVGNKKRFTKPVLVTTNVQTGIQQLGFITQTDLATLGIKEKKVAVYIPHSYAISGILMIVPTENVTPIDKPASEVMKFIVSGGVADVD